MNKEESEKVINTLKATFNQGLSRDGETAFLKITFNNDLKKLIKRVVINDFIVCSNYDFNSGDEILNPILKRYKVKSPIFNSLYGDEKELIFLKSLLDNGKHKFNFNELSRLERFKINFKDILHKCIGLVLSCEVSQTITFKTGGENDN